MKSYLLNVPYLPLGLALAFLFALLIAITPIHRLFVNRFFCFLGAGALGLVAAATLSPSRWASPSDVLKHCSTTFTDPISWSTFLAGHGQRVGNVALFIPIGIAFPFVRRWWAIPIAAIGCALLPFAVEYSQFALPQLGRACDFVDIVDNETGLMWGAIAGVSLRILWSLGELAIRRFDAARQ